MHHIQQSSRHLEYPDEIHREELYFEMFVHFGIWALVPYHLTWVAQIAQSHQISKA